MSMVSVGKENEAVFVGLHGAGYESLTLVKGLQRLAKSGRSGWIKYLSWLRKMATIMFSMPTFEHLHFLGSLFLPLFLLPSA